MFTKFKNVVMSKKFVVGSAIASVSASMPIVAHAEPTGGSTNDSLITSLTSAFQSQTQDILKGIGQIAPIALPILGAVLVVTIGIKIYKMVAKQR